MRVRIVCKAPPSTSPPTLPSWWDVSVLAVDENGVEHQLDGVMSARWECRTGEVARAVLELHGVEIDVDATVPSDIIVTTPAPSELRGLRGDILEEHDGYVIATVGDDPRPLRLDAGSFVRLLPTRPALPLVVIK